MKEFNSITPNLTITLKYVTFSHMEELSEPKTHNALLDLDPIDPLVTAYARRAATIITQWQMLEGRYPTTNELLRLLNSSRSQLTRNIAEVNRILTLESRGLQPFEIEGLEPTISKIERIEQTELDPQFLVATELIVNPIDKRAHSLKLKEAGLTQARWRYLSSIPVNKAYFKRRVDDEFTGMAEEAKIALAKNIMNGDLQSIKHFHEITQKVENPNQRLLLNLGVIIGRLMEALSSLVDKDTMIAISDQWDQIIDVSAREVNETNPLIPLKELNATGL